VPTAFVVKAGQRWPRQGAIRHEVDFATWPAKENIEFVRAGTPTGVSLLMRLAR
jgi:hypothetical protein